jgi:hypothetical protein
MDDRAGLGVGVIPSLEEEWDVPNVVQAEGNQGAFDQAVDGERQRRPAVHRPVREAIDRITNGRPDKAEDRADEDHGERGNDGDRALAREEAEVTGELDFVEAIECPRRDQPHDNSAEHAGLDRRDTHNARGFDAAQLGADAHRREEDDVADRPGECGDTVVFGQSDGYTDGKEQGQVREDRVTRGGHHLGDDLGQPCEVGAAHAEQDARHGEHRDRQHHALADLLEE